MIRRPPRSTQSRSSAASDVYKRQEQCRKSDRRHLGTRCATVEPQTLLCPEVWMTILSTLFTCYPQQRNISISDSHAPTFAYSSLCGGRRALYLNSAVQEQEVSHGAVLGGSRVSPDRVRCQVR